MEYGAPKHFPPKAPCSMSLEIDFILEISFSSCSSLVDQTIFFFSNLFSNLFSFQSLFPHQDPDGSRLFAEFNHIQYI